MLYKYLNLLFDLMVFSYFLLFKSFRYRYKLYKFRKFLPKYNVNTSAILLGNGPSLDDDIESVISERDSSIIYAVNFFIDSDFFYLLKPDSYIVLDPIFWSPNLSTQFISKRNNFIFRLNDINWKMILYVPEKAYVFFSQNISNKNVNLIKFPMCELPIMSNNFLYVSALRFSLGSPFGSNVLIYSIWTAIQNNHLNIDLYGVDMDIFKFISVSKNNELYTGGMHVYDKVYSPEPTKFLNYPNKSVSERLYQHYVTFRMLDIISIFADCQGISIVNKSSHSLIDSFKRKR